MKLAAPLVDDFQRYLSSKYKIISPTTEHVEKELSFIIDEGLREEFQQALKMLGMFYQIYIL